MLLAEYAYIRSQNQWLRATSLGKVRVHVQTGRRGGWGRKGSGGLGGHHGGIHFSRVVCVTVERRGISFMLAARVKK